MERNVVVGVADEPTSRHVVLWAAEEARHRGALLRIVHVVQHHAAVTATGAFMAREYDDVVERAAANLLQRAAGWVRTSAPGLVVETELDHESPRYSLLRAAKEADLVVVGTRGHGGVPGLSLGSTSLSVATHAPCPVVVVPAPRTQPGHGVVVGVDGSERGQAAVAFAVDEAERTGEVLTVVHVWDRSWPYDTPAPDSWYGTVVSQEEGAHDLLLAEACAGIAEEHPDLVVRRQLVKHGVPAHALLQEAAHARLLVVGARGRGAVAAFLFGSVSHSVLHTADVPVAVVRHPLD